MRSTGEIQWELKTLVFKCTNGTPYAWRLLAVHYSIREHTTLGTVILPLECPRSRLRLNSKLNSTKTQAGKVLARSFHIISPQQAILGKTSKTASQNLYSRDGSPLYTVMGKTPY